MIINLRLPCPLGTHTLTVSPAAPASTLLLHPNLPPSLSDSYLRTRTALVCPTTPLSALLSDASPGFPLDIELVPRLRGGKGGFGANLRAAGGRMNASKSTNFDSCRDLSGRRLGAIKEAQRQSDLVESLPDLQAKAAAEDKAKLETIERRLGLSSDDKEGAKRLAEVDLGELARKKHKFDDDKFLEESREIKEGVRNAVGAALLKKRKKKAAKEGEEVKVAPAAAAKAAAKPKAAAAVKATTAAKAAPKAPAKVATTA